MTDPKITSIPCWSWHTVQRIAGSCSLGFWSSRSKHNMFKSIGTLFWNGWLASRKFHVNGAWRFVAKIDNRVSWKGKLLLYSWTPCPVWRFPKPAHPEARKARKPSLQTTCPRQQRRMPNSHLMPGGHHQLTTPYNSTQLSLVFSWWCPRSLRLATKD